MIKALTFFKVLNSTLTALINKNGNDYNLIVHLTQPLSQNGAHFYITCYLLTSIIIISTFSVRLLPGVEIINHQIFTKSQVNDTNCCIKHKMKIINGQAIPMKVTNIHLPLICLLRALLGTPQGLQTCLQVKKRKLMVVPISQQVLE